MEKVRFGIIGIGNMGSQHSTYLHAGEIDGAELTAVCDLKQDRLDWAKSKFEGVATFTDYKEMLASGLIDAVIVAVPHSFHPQLTIDALNAGINVICIHQRIPVAENPEVVKVFHGDVVVEHD